MRAGWKQSKYGDGDEYAHGATKLALRGSVPALLRGAVFAAGVGYAGDAPFAILPDHVEEIGAAVVDFAVDVEVEGRPDDGEVVVDFDEGVVDTLFDFGGAGDGDLAGEIFEGHLHGFAVAHQDHDPAGEGGLPDSGGVARGHAGEHRLDGGEDGLFIRRVGGVKCQGREGGECKYECTAHG